VEQIMNVQLHLDKLEKGDVVSHVVVMGIGEPFDNFENMLDFLKVLMDHKGLAIAGRRITVSTSGLAHKIYEFTDTQLQVNLAISLHAPNNELRTQIMKINRGIPIEKLMKSLDYYLEKTNRRITIEYILLKDVNDHKEEAEQLADLLDDKKHRLYVNLIPYNPVDEHSQYQRSDKESVLSFYDTLKKRGINCKIRQEHGTDIDAACGQLRSKQIKKAEAK
jgi:23S rRNA (adenine2503-C2)-methyltransferase